MNIQWYPGHMTKTRRMMEEHLKLVDLVAEVIDARIPISSRNPDIDALVGVKPRLVIFNRCDQADPAGTKAWTEYFHSQKIKLIETDSKSGAGVKQFSAAVSEVLRDKVQVWREKGQVGRTMRVMVVGVPNVGKSTFINRVAGRKSATAENRPGVTRGKQWIKVDNTLELLDTPGILWPKFEDETIGLHLAFTGAVKDAIMDIETLSFHLMQLLYTHFPERIEERYKIPAGSKYTGWELLELAGKKRGFLISGGEIDLERMARVLLEEYRSGKLGRITLEWPQRPED